MATIGRVRFPVVLFDLDGTVVDSGAIILASMRHATQTVLAREYSEQELMANVGGPGLEAQMEAFAPERVDELVRVYRAHNEPLHDELEAFAGHRGCARDAEGRRAAQLGLVTAKRRSTVELAFARLPIAHLFDTVVGGDETERHKPTRRRSLLGLERLGADRRRGRLRRRLAVRHAGCEGGGPVRGRRHLGADPRPRRRSRDADVVVDTAEELLAVL